MSGTASDPFFWNDWAGEPLLRMCSFAAQGYWMRLLCIAAESRKKGFVLVNGKKPSDEDLHKITGAPLDMIPIWTAELLSTGTASKNRHGIIYNRRMVALAKKRAASKKGGEIGGRTTYENKKGIFGTQDPTQDPTQGGTQHPRRAPLPFPIPSPSKKKAPLAKANGRSAPLPAVSDKPKPKTETPDPWRDVYAKGREIFKDQGGAIVTGFRKAFGDKKHNKAMATLLQCQDAVKPLEYAYKILHEHAPPGTHIATGNFP
jgi:hypothetical protein